MRKNKSFCFYSASTILLAFHWTILINALVDSTNQKQAADYSSANRNSSTSTLTTLPNFCPLGEPLRSSTGELVLCNCPPRPFCPMLYYCKTEMHGQNGICCPDFGADRRYKVKPEDSRLPLYGSLSKNNNKNAEPCPAFGCMTASLEGNSNTNNGDSYKSVPLEPKETQTNKPEEPKKNCPAIQLSDIQPLPSADCVYEELTPGPDGCPRPPKVKCPAKPKVECKPVAIPLVAPGCTIGPETYDENGCLLPIQVTCETTEAPTASPTIYPRSPGSVPVVTEVPKPKPQPVIVPFAPGTNSVRASNSFTRDYMAPTYAPSPPPCPTYSMPATLSPDCEIAPQRKDEFGCLLPPEIRCQKKATAYAPIVQEKMAAESTSNSNFSPGKNSDKSNYGIKTQCPQISMPKVQPGCKLLPSKYDSNGCMLVPEITCDPTIINAKQCPVVQLPKMDPLCTFGPDRNDSQGCPMVPEIICPATPEPGPSTTILFPEPATQEPHNIPRMLSHCPYVAPPYLPPGCHYGPAKYDAYRCSVAPEIVCPDNLLFNNDRNILDNSSGQSAAQARRFGDMLTAEFYHIVRSSETPDASAFRKSAAIPVVTAGKFHACRIHADCFHYREPREWCQTSSPQSQSVWTEKSCHCAEDTLVPACIVERMNRGIREWSFCADYAQCVQQ